MTAASLTRALCTTLSIVLLLQSVAPFLPTGGETGAPADTGNTGTDGSPIWATAGDWTVEDGDLVAHAGRTIVVNGDLVIDGNLSLTGVKLVVTGNVTVRLGNLTAEGLEVLMQAANGSANVFEVGPGGNMEWVNGSFAPTNTSNPYTVHLGGPSDLTNVTFNRTGTKTTDGVAWGVKVSGATVTMTKCVFHDGEGAGLYVDPAWVTLADTTFTDMPGPGVVVQGSHLDMTGCTFTNVSAEGALVMNSSSFFVWDCDFTGDGTGVVIERCGPDAGPALFGNDNVTRIGKSTLDGVGLLITDSEFTVEKNNVRDVNGTGIDVSDTPAEAAAELTLNTVTRCAGAAFHLSGPGIGANNNTADKSAVGFQADDAVSLTLKDNTVRENDLGINVTGTFMQGPVGSTPPTVSGNTLIGNGVGVITHADAGEFEANAISGSTDAGFVITGAAAAGNLTGNTLTGNDGSGIMAAAGSMLTLTGGTVQGNGLTGAGAPEVMADCQSATITGGTIGGGGTVGIHAAGATAVTLEGVTFDASSADDCILLDGTSTANLSGTQLDAGRIAVNGTGAASSSWDVDVDIYGPGSAPLPNATFAIDNATGGEVYNATAPLPSFIHPVTVYMVDQDGIHTYAPHTFKAIHPENGYRAVTRDVTGGASMSLRVLPRDMYIDALAFSAGWALPDEEFTVSADVRNTGPGDVGPVAVRLLVSSVTAGTDLDNRTVELSGIPAGGNATAEFGTFSFAEPGTLEFMVIADPTVKYVETDGTNNTLSSQFLINGRPVANLTAEDDEVLTGEEVVFNGSASSDADGIASYRFVFGDGSSTGWSASPGATHTYANDGTYTASLWARDTYGAQSSRASTLSVTILNRAPLASFTYAPDEGGSIETLFRFESTSADTDGTVEDFSWDFGDGSASTDPEPSHTYGDDGEFTVTLTVTDDDGGVSPEFFMDVTVGNLLPTIVLTGEGAKGGIKYTGNVLEFDASGTRDPDDPFTLLSFSWEMGDGTTYTDAAVNHTYQEPGEYTVTITVEDDDSVSTDESTYVTRTIHLIIRAGDAGPEEPEPEEEVEEEGSLGWAGEMWYVWVIVVVAVVGVVGMILGRRDRTPVEMSMPLHCDHCDSYFPPEDLKEEDKCPECNLVISDTAAEVVELTEAPGGLGIRGRRQGRP